MPRTFLAPIEVTEDELTCILGDLEKLPTDSLSPATLEMIDVLKRLPGHLAEMKEMVERD
jgi:hypothetical protein